jgi:methionine-S-sulfoxide reductase
MSASETIVLAGGCFWCTEAVFKEVRGVLDIESGYSNGQAERPTYEEVCTGRTGCAEVIKLTFDSAQIGLRQVLEIFFWCTIRRRWTGRATTAARSTAAASIFRRPRSRPWPRA